MILAPVCSLIAVGCWASDHQKPSSQPSQGWSYRVLLMLFFLVFQISKSMAGRKSTNFSLGTTPERTSINQSAGFLGRCNSKLAICQQLKKRKIMFSTWSVDDCGLMGLSKHLTEKWNLCIICVCIYIYICMCGNVCGVIVFSFIWNKWFLQREKDIFGNFGKHVHTHA